MRSRFPLIILSLGYLWQSSPTWAGPEDELSITSERRESSFRSLSSPYQARFLQNDHRLALKKQVASGHSTGHLTLSHAYGRSAITYWQFGWVGRSWGFSSGDLSTPLPTLAGNYLPLRGIRFAFPLRQHRLTIQTGRTPDRTSSSRLGPTFSDNRYILGLTAKRTKPEWAYSASGFLSAHREETSFLGTPLSPKDSRFLGLEARRTWKEKASLVSELALSDHRRFDTPGNFPDAAWKLGAVHRQKSYEIETMYRYQGPDFLSPNAQALSGDYRQWSSYGSARWRTILQGQASFGRDWFNRHHDSRRPEGTAGRQGFGLRVSPPRFPSLGWRSEFSQRNSFAPSQGLSRQRISTMTWEVNDFRAGTQTSLRLERLLSKDRAQAGSYFSRGSFDLRVSYRFRYATTFEASERLDYHRSAYTPEVTRFSTFSLGGSHRLRRKLTLTGRLLWSGSKNRTNGDRTSRFGSEWTLASLLPGNFLLYARYRDDLSKNEGSYENGTRGRDFDLRLSKRMGLGDLGWSTLDGEVFNDLNNDGSWDTGEELIPGIRIEVPGHGQAYTDSLGRFEIKGLKAGRHKAALDLKTLPADLNPARAPEKTFLAKGLGTTSVSFPVRSLGSISGSVYEDLNRNNRWDLEEKGVGGALVLLSEAGRSTWTTSDGSYSFANLSTGHYRVEIDVPNLPDDFAPTTSSVQEIVLPEHGRIRQVDFGVAERQRPVIKTIFPPTPAPPPQPVRPRVAPAPAPRPAPLTGPGEVKKLKSQARRLFLLEDYLGALQAWNKVLSLNPQDSEARAQAERARARLKKLEEKP